VEPSERWLRLQDILTAGMELRADARASFFARACEEDPDLMTELAALLQADEAAGDGRFIQDAIIAAAADLLRDRRRRPDSR
jgi:hypothetical protein